MNLLNIDLSYNMLDVIDAFTEVLGMEYIYVIAKRVSNIFYVMYNNVDGMEDYVDFLERCKQKELAIKFLEQIGIDVSKQQEKSYAEDLDDDISKLIDIYIGGYRKIQPSYRYINSGINAWRALNEDGRSPIVENYQIRLINFLRGENATPITQETFQEFCGTDEYQKLSEKIKQYLQVYDQILEEYDVFLQQIAPYQKYVEDESKRRKDMETNRRNILYEQVMDFMSDDIKAFLDKQYSSIDEKSKAFFGIELGAKSYVEYFSEEDEWKLSDTSISENDKDMIYHSRGQYFEGMCKTMDKKSFDFETDREFYEYCIQQEHIKKLIPTAQLATQINQLRTKAYEEFKRDFIYSSQDFIENAKRFVDPESAKKSIYERQKENLTCIYAGANNNGFMPILCYTVRRGDGGALDYTFLHEVEHCIKAEGVLGKVGDRTGFDFAVNDSSLNPYNKQKRKYERLNETITDIFALETRQVLHEKGIYLLEPKEIIIEDLKDRNTHSIVKNLLTRFLERYRKPIIRASIYGDMKGLYDIIGEENFEELNDVVNRVDSLKGLESKLKDNKIEDPVVVEYHRQLERLEQIYANMEIHQSRNLSDDNVLTI